MVNKFFLSLPIIIGIAAIIILLSKSDDRRFNDYASMEYQLDGKKYNLIIADTDEKKTMGLMYVKKLRKYDGMIFLFNDKDYRTFWNKNTLIDLTLYWIDGDRVMGKSELSSINKTKNIATVSSQAQVDKVIEILK